jgi:hypothetical protein
VTAKRRLTVMEAVSGWSMVARLGQTDRSGMLAKQAEPTALRFCVVT